MTVTEELGAAEDLVSVTPSHGTCTQAAPVTCTLGSLAPGAAMSVTTRVRFARTGDADLLARTTKVRADCTYSITIPFGTTQARRRYGPKGKVLVQARFSGNRAVASAGSASDRP